MNKKIRFYLFAMLVAIPLIMTSCYPGGVEYYEDTDIVMTNHDTEFNFKENKLYFMPDSIKHIVDEGNEDEVNRKYDDDILKQVADHLEAAGYTRLEDPTAPDSVLIDSADVAVAIVVTSTEYSSIGYWPGGGWWGWYPGYPWGPGYGPGYPWNPGYYPGYPTYYSYAVGSLFIEMANVDEIDDVDEEIPVVWQATVNGLLSSSEENVYNRVVKSIDQAFEQSPYLSK